MTPSPAPIDPTRFQVEQIGFIPWSAEFQPDRFVVSLVQPDAVPPISLPLMLQNAGDVWVVVNGLGARFATSELRQLTSLQALPFADHTMTVETPAAATYGPTLVTSTSTTGALQWRTEISVGGVDQVWASLVNDHDTLYLITQDEAQQQTTLWQLDPASGAATKRLVLEEFAGLWVYDAVAYFTVGAGPARTLHTRALSDGTEASIGALPAEYPDGVFELIGPHPRGIVAYRSADELWVYDLAGAELGRYTAALLVPSTLRSAEPPLRLGLGHTIMQPDGALVYPAVNEQGVYLLRLSWP